MEHLHQPALDVLGGRFATTATQWPASRHALLSVPCESEVGAFPSFAPSASLPASQGLSISLGLEPASEDSQQQVFRHLTTRAWFARGHRAWRGRASLEWLGVEAGTAHLPFAAPAAAPLPLRWRAQTYLVQAKGGVEKALDHSFVLRAYRAPPATVAAGGVVTAADCSSLTLQSSLVANLSQFPDAALQPDLFGPKRNLLVGGLEVAFASAPRQNPLNVRAFVDSDGLVAGGALFKRWDRKEDKATLAAVPAPATCSSSIPGLDQFRALLSAACKWLPVRLQLESTSSGLESAWVQEARDFTATLGVAQQFRWLPRSAASRSGLLPALPPCTLASSMQFYGHIMTSLHVPVTPRLACAASLNTQITNDESVLSAAATYALNEAQQVAVAADSRGGVRLAWRTRVHPMRHEPTSWLGRLLARTTLVAHVQAFPLMPQLLPAWTARATGLTGATYSPQQVVDLKHTQVSCGLSLEFNAE